MQCNTIGTNRKTAKRGGQSSIWSDTRLEPDFRSYELADAVAVKPVSNLKFPANRLKNREFCKVVASGAPETINITVVKGPSVRIPDSTEQEIISAKQGSLGQEQIKLPANIGIIAV
jgi:hypothetical protein